MSEYLETTVDKFRFRVATDRLYGTDGVWALELDDGGVRLGLSDYVQQRSGDAAFIHPKPVGAELAVGDEFAELETIKVNVSLLSPLSGEIAEVNKDLDLDPENINQDPYGKGWLVTVEATDWQADREKLLDPPAYLAAMRRQAEAEMEAS